MQKIRVSYLGKEKTIKIEKNLRVIDLLKKLKINSETVLIRRKREIILDTEILQDKDKIEIFRIVSGG